MSLATLTKDELEIRQAKAQEARRSNAAARKSSKLRRDFLSSDAWDDLARQHKLRLPPWGEAPTASNLRSWLRKIGLKQTEYEQQLGCSLGEYIGLNPDWPLRALAAVALEYVAERS